MVVIDLTALRPHTLGHRQLEAGETVARIQLRSEEDVRWFRGQLKWSAFKLVPVDPKAAIPEDAGAEVELLGDEVERLKDALTAKQAEVDILKEAVAAQDLVIDTLTKAEAAAKPAEPPAAESEAPAATGEAAPAPEQASDNVPSEEPAETASEGKKPKGSKKPKG